MQGRNLVLVGFAVVLGLIAVVIANAYFTGVEQKQAAVAEQQKLVRIVVATKPLEYGEPVTEQTVRLQNFPANSVPQGAFTSIPEVLKDNRVALRPIVIGEPILRSKVSGTDGRATLAALLPDGFRAVSIPVNNVNGVAGFVLPGLMVDVLLLRQIEGDGADQQDQRADVVLEGAQVLAVDQLADEKTGQPKVSRTVTLAVTPQDASRLAVANRMGTLQLTLRKMEPMFAVDREGDQPRLARTVTSRNLGLPRLVIGGKNRGGGGGGGYSPPPAPQLASINPPSMVNAVSVPMGPAMTVVRGTEPTSYQVGTLGSR
ncbi:Flp pilus assembly protein CpaB [Tsuneonella sp. YG55]|uniref:Flp pilus assembly protein CpaB n=1 Tax=Tsuneonella litorea TaxID=2976475 RepID=A0A9X2W2H8_9SPHN|nr:Flp pilus assembly protein CpaB [Tsuneonella litorea]MCT2559379.1 Flp pilus assembly protein CpaB [Tsuneonella litorea]